ncbi:hypothetical protein CWI75_14515 [Kineobactrum sediminis]|uniref:Kinase n=1 Tax=Kineobactrum sediminis TaxID=1905677 RepID=A0A2N5Y008_9GAMM|nr:hypothetical protein CWI75_14515 [Kineobactrum sediminis]
MEGERDSWRSRFLARHQLPPAYLASAQQWFDPLMNRLAAHRSGAPGPMLVAVNGCQGSGKTTFCDYLRHALEAESGLKTLALSLDDFYLGRGEREALAARVHPLLATRGVPGTHDMSLLAATLDSLSVAEAEQGETLAIPRFNKATDDRLPRSRWDRVGLPVDIILLEGWCLGARPQSVTELTDPCNNLERDEDTLGLWRQYVNDRLAADFLPLYARVDFWIMLQAPSFACVRRWRQEQEDKLIASLAGTASAHTMTPAALARFIQHYERLTRHCLETLPAQVDVLLRLDERRQIMDCKRRVTK